MSLFDGQLASAGPKYKRVGPPLCNKNAMRKHLIGPRLKDGNFYTYGNRVQSGGRCKSLARLRASRGVVDATDEMPPDGTPCVICHRCVDLVLDHDHKTGRRRGWLCRHCNQVVGWVELYGEQITFYLA